MNSTHFSSKNVVATQSCCWLICFGFKKSSGHQNGFGSLIPCKETLEVFSSVLGGYWVIFKACIIGLSKHICFLCLRTKNLIKQTSGTKNVLKKANDSHLDAERFPKNNNHFQVCHAARSSGDREVILTGTWLCRGVKSSFWNPGGALNMHAWATRALSSSAALGPWDRAEHYPINQFWRDLTELEGPCRDIIYRGTWMVGLKRSFRT